MATAGKGLLEYNTSEETVKQFPSSEQIGNSPSSNSIYEMHLDKHNNLWLATSNGVNKVAINGESLNFIRVQSKHNEYNGRVASVSEDKTGKVWVSFSLHGLNILESTALEYKYSPGDYSESFLREELIKVHHSQNNITLATTVAGKLLKLNAQAFKYNYVKKNDGEYFEVNRIIPQPKNKMLYSDNSNLYAANSDLTSKLIYPELGYISSFTTLSDERILLSVDSKGIYQFNSDTGEISQFSPKSTGLPNYAIQSILYDNSTLWVGLYRTSDGTLSGLYKYIENENRYVQITSQMTIEQIFDLGDKLLLATRNKGVAVLDKVNLSLINIKNIKDLKSRCVYQDFEDVIWICSNSRGLYQFDRSSLSLIAPVINDKFSNQSIRNIIQDDLGFYWISTESQLFKYNMNNDSLRLISSSDGLRPNNYISRSVAKLEDGSLVFGGFKGLVKFNPADLNLESPKNDHKIHLQDFKLFNKPVQLAHKDPNSPLKKPIHMLDKLELTYKDSLFSLSFFSTDYLNQEKLEYYYKLDGLKGDWIKAENQMATFTTLPADDYVFRVRAKHVEEGWYSDETLLPISVSPPIWKTWQAYVLYLLTILTAIYIFYRQRVRSFEKRAAELEKGIAEATQELQHKNEIVNSLLNQKQRFLANVSHEFRTPLTMILSPLDVMLNKNPESSVATTLTMMKRNGRRLLRMVDQLLDLAHSESSIEVTRKRYSLRKTVQTLLYSFEPLFDAKSITFTTNRFEDTQIILVSDSLEKILINLLSNAVKYTPDNRSIDLKVTVENSQITFNVSDTGVGISEENQKLIFNRFTRATEQNEENIPGAGIGLALVKELVSANGGEISVTSELNQGSTFTVVLPIKDESEFSHLMIEDESGTPNVQQEVEALSEIENTRDTETTTQEDEVSDTEDGAQPLVLITEDNTDMRQFLFDSFSEKYRCLMASNGKDALELAHKHIPDLIITDVMMPVMDGYELTQRLKEDTLTSHIPIIMLTAKGDAESRMQGFRRNVDDYLAKPFNLEELMLRAHNLLSIRRILQRKFATQLVQPGEVTIQADDESEEKDIEFLNKFKELIANHYDNIDLKRQDIANELNISERQFSRKLKALSDYSFSEYLRQYRVHKSLELMQQGMQVSAIAYTVGFSSVGYFGRCFKAEIGVTPKEYVEASKKDKQ
ncbi:ATP-binding protein [Pleionea sp. CnH1-48]|uniref:ATP-binding protein n=1 Tax=Pleionea sp. CnH1-48 TaxID=2954494 RepID=UPI002097DC8F